MFFNKHANMNELYMQWIKKKSWLSRLDKANVSYFCWSLSNKNESCSLLKASTKKTAAWKTRELSSAGKYIRSRYRARRKALGKRA